MQKYGKGHTLAKKARAILKNKHEGEEFFSSKLTVHPKKKKRQEPKIIILIKITTTIIISN